MNSYVGCHLVQARPMTRGEYLDHRGWELPLDENPDDEGYLINYMGYETWSLRSVFELQHVNAADLNIDMVKFIPQHYGTYAVVTARFPNGFELTKQCGPNEWKAAMEELKAHAKFILSYVHKTAMVGF